ncbi:LuxR C-terminal-related transcriptional regulator [Paenibacillus sp. PK3_47]|uniref:helix-turn-helix domain-containing protein n=1 Tax=Paenibacillus sp. PK3_47 TaxID=2072642 RepID=UPI00201E3BA2|nr:LuxR C-terminal-related transcriptional regulator [Paenibacillus sp. PK3_47]
MTATYDQPKVWYSPEDLEKEQLDSFFSPGKAKPSADCEETKTPSFSNAGQKSVYHKAMITSLHKELLKIRKYISIDFAFFLTDEAARIIDLQLSSPAIQEEFDRAGLRVGMSLAKQNLGMNAVSLAAELNSIAVVKGKEHSSPLFFDWNCVCSPLYSDGVIQGYVDISFYNGQQIELAIPLMRQIAENVGGKWMRSHPELQLLQLENHFEKYSLTGRERDVAQMWLAEKSALYISNELGISEGTVRNVVKSMYNKMKVTDRWQFIKKLTPDPANK